ncbi:septum formation initiator family protein [Persephonella atlantica]|uniref:Septum formation initiator family protein n=1 Tax=Persephonella atlantica TaxID=2699429 RepID=A0ABS1GFV4_9AQUI|nr:septum formation initiator family protein [Persephonella atlantica]MBK3331804.1 septum formation initiator family protein [Persephonella atlantica]
MQYSKEKKFFQGLSDRIKELLGVDSVLLFFSLLLFLYFVFYIFLGERNIFRLIQKEKYRDSLRHEIKQLTEENIQLRDKIDYLKSDLFFIEKKAREDLGLVKDGEEIYIIVDRDGKIKGKERRWIDRVLEKYQEFKLR